MHFTKQSGYILEIAENKKSIANVIVQGAKDSQASSDNQYSIYSPRGKGQTASKPLT